MARSSTPLVIGHAHLNLQNIPEILKLIDAQRFSERKLKLGLETFGLDIAFEIELLRLPQEKQIQILKEIEKVNPRAARNMLHFMKLYPELEKREISVYPMVSERNNAESQKLVAEVLAAAESKNLGKTISKLKNLIYSRIATEDEMYEAVLRIKPDIILTGALHAKALAKRLDCKVYLVDKLRLREKVAFAVGRFFYRYAKKKEMKAAQRAYPRK